MKKLVLFIYCVFPAIFYPQVQKYTPKVSLAIETYAFLKGQSYALQMIASQFPALQPNIAAAEKSSKVLFGRAERNIELFLEDELENSEFNKLQNDLDSLLKEQFKNPIEKEKYALDFLVTVKDRPHLIIDTLLLKGILSFAYHDAPHQEITDGHIKTFNTKGHHKAEQASLKLSLPKSWLAEEAEMPETIQQFTSYYGTGNEKFLIVVYDLPQEYDIILDQNSISEMIPPKSKIIRTTALTIDGRPGMMVEVEETIDSADDKMKIRMLQFMFVLKRKLYCLQGSIGPVEVSKNLEFQIKKYEPLFRLIAAKAQIDK
ncbi:hypothetical protein [Flavobacterium piscis]|uniref:Uncharacterized protein n=1 Tax=Flavobacterium piscis TaxID=1114874 RepID=A0ABU1Y9Z3_9FLAO|nr:hypothetical protein [Flavobacterium piscis]MDR7211050.1 hypothetical protein [Flavobacterium piscis]